MIYSDILDGTRHPRIHCELKTWFGGVIPLGHGIGYIEIKSNKIWKYGDMVGVTKCDGQHICYGLPGYWY